MLRAGLMGAVLSLALAGAAAAEPFQSFADMCVATNADAHAAEVVVKGAGWQDITSQMPPDSEQEFRDTAVFLNFDPADPGSMAPEKSMEILMTGWGDGETVLDAKGLILDLCGVLSPQADVRRMTKQLTDHLGLPASTDESETVWVYSRQGERFESEAGLLDAEDEDFLAAVRSRSLYAVFVHEADGLAGLVVGAVRPAAKADR